jgi:peptidoglycan/LPS O-acetylase OafA/YrhL
VDIFFVISGYLISGILYKGVREDGFSFREFYARRVRRLFPALITVLLLCLGYGYFVLLSDEFRQLGKHVAAGTLFIQNFVFWQESGYWDVASSLKPLLHLWSLAVEEQFYIIFPPLLLLIWKRKWPMVVILWILLGVSMIANLVMSGQDRSSDFYLTTYRAWEFLVGSLLAWWHYGKSHEEESPYGNVLSVLGIILLAMSMVLLKEKEPYPGWRAIFPVAGSIALIAAGKKNWINRTILSNPAVVWIGLISYPLYLFHWPALSFVHIIKGENTDPSYIWGALGVTFLLTVATYYLVERPIRFSKARWTVALLTGAFLLTGLLGMLVWRKGIHARSSPEIEKINKAIADRDFFQGWQKNYYKPGRYVWECGGPKKEVLCVGDSNMWQFAPRIVKLIQDQGGETGVIMTAYTGCPPIDGVENPVYAESRYLMESYHDMLRDNPNIKVVVFASHWDAVFSKKYDFFLYHGMHLNESRGMKEAIDSFGVMINHLVKEGKKVFVVLSVPQGEVFDPKQSIKRTFLGVQNKLQEKVSIEDFMMKIGHAQSRSILSKISSDNGATVIDPIPHMSTNGYCIAEDENGPIRFDDRHLKPKYVQAKIRFIDIIFNK